MEKKAVTGILTGLITDNRGVFPDYHHIYVNKGYINVILTTGDVPIMIPMNGNRAALSAVIDRLDALLIIDSGNIDPICYGEEPYRGLSKIMPERGNYDFTLYEFVRERHLPILGMRHNFQLTNVAGSDSLYQDLDEHSGEALKHSQGHNPRVATHNVAVKMGSRLAEILGITPHRVNSFHHQMVKKVGELFTEAMMASGGVVEAVELPNDDPLTVMQWHPEVLESINSVMRKLRRTFIAAGQRHQTAKS